MKKRFVLFVCVSAVIFFGSQTQLSHGLKVERSNLSSSPASPKALEITCSCGATCLSRGRYYCRGGCDGGNISECYACVDECCEVACRVEGCSGCELQITN
jgi:hypothetical protein